MRHPTLGRLVYDADNRRWRGFYAFSHLLPYSMPAEESALSDRQTEEITRKTLEDIDVLKDRMRDQFGAGVEELFAALEEESRKAQEGGDVEDQAEEEDLESPEERAAQIRDEARLRQELAQKKDGNFPILFESDAEKTKPSPYQRETLRFLLENEASIARQVLDALYESYRQYYSDKRWRQICNLPNIRSPKGVTRLCHLERVVVTREHFDGYAYLLFPVECTWEIEHGMYVVVHPERGTEWATGDTAGDLLESDELFDEENAPPNQDLVDAVYARDEQRVQELIAKGHDINAVGDKDPYPPLCGAVEQMDVDLVRRLLTLGANPELRDPEGKTALDRARRMLRDTLPSKGNKLMEAAMNLARKVNPGAFKEVEDNLTEIIRLLEQADAK